MLAQLLEQQQGMQDAIAQLATAVQSKPPIAVEIMRGPDGRAQQFVMRPTNGG
jgi:hypothetical protein